VTLFYRENIKLKHTSKFIIMNISSDLTKIEVTRTEASGNYQSFLAALPKVCLLFLVWAIYLCTVP
jgi:hypothetical protein